MPSIDFARLSAPFDPSVVSWRVGSTTTAKDRGLPLAYIDARDVMERLDDVCGPAAWQCRYAQSDQNRTICEIGLLILSHRGCPRTSPLLPSFTSSL